MKTTTYCSTATLDDILSDGWARGFEVNQTLKEAKACGFIITATDVRNAWAACDDEYASYIRNNEPFKRG